MSLLEWLSCKVTNFHRLRSPLFHVEKNWLRILNFLALCLTHSVTYFVFVFISSGTQSYDIRKGNKKSSSIKRVNKKANFFAKSSLMLARLFLKRAVGRVFRERGGRALGQSKLSQAELLFATQKRNRQNSPYMIVVLALLQEEPPTHSSDLCPLQTEKFLLLVSKFV